MTDFENNKEIILVDENKEMSLTKKDKLDIEKQIEIGISKLSNRGVFNELYTLGNDSLKISKESQDLISGQISKMVEKDDNQLVTDLTSLKTAAQGLNPKKFTKHSIIDKGLSIVGFDRYRHRIKAALTKYESAEKIMKEIIAALENGKEALERDITGLLSLEDGIIEQQKQVINDIYVIEVLLNKLKKGALNVQQLGETSVQQLKESANINLLDLRVLKEANNQFIIIIKQTCHNAKIQIQSINRACGITVKLALIGLIMRSAMENNKRVSKACKASQEFLSSQLVFNAKMFKEQTVEIAEAKNAPVASIDQLGEAHNIINEAINESIKQVSNVNDTIVQYLEKLDRIDTNKDKSVR